MRYAAWSLLLAAFCAAAAVYVAGDFADSSLLATTGAQAGEPAAAKPGAPPPLVVDDNAPLLLDATPAKDKAKTAKGPVADNSACHVCHTNYDQESLAVVHARENVGCMKCHGESIPHRNDEDNITPPDIMYPADAIEAACLKCHETHNVPAKKVIAVWQKRCPAKENPSDLLCTDCHGEHRMKFRTVWWDKKTRKLADRQGKRIKVAPDYTKKPGEKPAEKPAEKPVEKPVEKVAEKPALKQPAPAQPPK